MLGHLATATLLLTLAAADFNGAASGVISAADQLASKVNAWNSGTGLQGALGIQGAFPAFTAALGSLSGAIEGASAGTIDVGPTLSADASITSLLSALSAKAQDFDAVGAGSIVSNDLKEVAAPAQAIINDIKTALAGDEAKWGSLSASVSALESDLNAANKVYGIPEATFAAAPSFSGSSAAVSSLASSNIVAGSSAAVPTSGAIAHNSTVGRPSSAPGKNGTVSTTASHSQPVVHNGATGVTLGLGAAAAGVAALFI